LAWIYSERGDARAIEFATRAYEAKPDDPSIADTLGWLHVRGGDAAAGLPMLQQAIRGYPNHPEIRYHLAVALADSGDRRQALDMLEALLMGNEEFANRADALDLVAKLRVDNGR
jgi:tetratricopeptide (TPR) repeat protein